ncbi:glucose-6-phosphate isomerase family protein [Dubosiella newyorkensis]|uniref:glucose-6-phosphate isomerase family protein n=1 Tax=Dubosiella newyorkensis TaxID=1862672 RepID=UPI0032B0FD5E
MNIIESSLFHDFEKGMCGKEMQKSIKLYQDAKDFYAAYDTTLPNETCMYEVTSFLDPEGAAGHLNWGVSLLHPVLVDGECNMTRGHFHHDLSCEEYYWCAKGEGLLMLMDEQGNCWSEKMHVGTLHHIHGHHAHRLINTGNEDLEVICVWPANAGHDYAGIEEHPFPYRVYKENGEVIVRRRKND